MKKNILLILMFVTMFFIGSNNVFAAKICEIKDDENTTKECENKIKSYINSRGGELACLYEVELKDGNKTKKYYNYIYSTNNGVLHAGTTLGSEKNNLKLSRNESAWLLGDAYNNLYSNNQCPLHSYIDTKAYNEVCFDNGKVGDCLNNNEPKDTYTDFNETIKSELIEKNEDSIKYNNLYYNNSCDTNNLPQGYNNVCRYRNGGDYVLVVYNNSTSTIIYDRAGDGLRTIIKKGEKKQTDNPDKKDTDFEFYSNIYENNISIKANSCPKELYLNNYGTTEESGGSYIDNHKFELSKTPNSKTTIYELKKCGLDEEELPDNQGCEIINNELRDEINIIMSIIRIAVPILLIGLVTYDFATAVFAGDDKAVNKAKGNAIKRIIIAVIIFFVPTFVNLVFDLVNDVWGKNYEICGIEEQNQ